tara:strand:+ start:6419 stop:6664 length:246 start_codon:yes stop_codon:yes gene_type:complete
MSIKPLLSKIKSVYKNQSDSLIRTVIYTIGHFFIAASCVMYFTGASFYLALTDAIVEPILNGFWYYLLDRFWVNKNKFTTN